MKSSLLALPLAILLSVVLAKDVLSGSKELQKNYDIKVRSSPISFDQLNPKNKRFGRLTWRGGLNLSSDHDEFGGYSGIAVTKSGNQLLAVSDIGTWLRADLQYKNGMLSGIGKTRIGPLRKKSGKSLRRKKHSDAEDLALWKKKNVTYALISFERNHRIGRFPHRQNRHSKTEKLSQASKRGFQNYPKQGA